MRLVADIGGTNARVALCANGVIDKGSVERFSNADWESLIDLLRAYCDDHRGVTVDEMVIAVAGPVHAGRAKLTNRNWTINADNLAQVFACERVVLLNDLGALGYAVPMLGADQVVPLCGQLTAPYANGQALVVGIGTGCNISQVITKNQWTVCPPAEAGHISMPSAIVSKLHECSCNPDAFPTVEALFSGRGLTAFCRLFTGSEDVTGEVAISHYGAPGKTKMTAAIDTYAALLGLLLRDFSLSYMPSHGTFLAGSVARAISERAAEPLIGVFQEPCKFRLQETPSLFVVDEDGAALLGCAQF
ncbi:hypothetical protein PM03_11980 [Thalassobacter stenotrophicus]|uniref:glucokinase n=1 Tax=Thalassobacter TaxID=266808 RepID=UPI00051D6A94|nr:MULTISPECIES: glucokinase [Thalassobacter]KGK78720.1 hypothetical protein PM03_11980 [Thalassobacter stenotrophicus]KGL00974.1 hypothetical protein PM04_11520 [Thalassobacter sp. 16PALIMAR09]